MRRLVSNLVSIERDTAVIAAQIPHDIAHEGRLADTIAANDAANAPWLHRHRDGVQCGNGAVTKAQVFNGQCHVSVPGKLRLRVHQPTPHRGYHQPRLCPH
jgi:hypothetical protein